MSALDKVEELTPIWWRILLEPIAIVINTIISTAIGIADTYKQTPTETSSGVKSEAQKTVLVESSDPVSR